MYFRFLDSQKRYLGDINWNSAYKRKEGTWKSNLTLKVKLSENSKINCGEPFYRKIVREIDSKVTKNLICAAEIKEITSECVQ